MTVRYSIGFLFFTMGFLNKTRIGCSGKESIAQFGEEELTSSVKRIIQEVFVCHHDRSRTISYITQSGIVRGRSWTRQILSDAWESMITDTKLATEDQPRVLIREPLEVECRKFYVWSVNIEAHGHMGSCPGYALLIWQGKATKLCKDEFQKRIRRIIERTLTKKAMMDRTLAALVSPTKILNRDVAPGGDDIEPVGESRADVEMGNEEDEEPLEAEIPIQSKNESEESHEQRETRT